MKRAKGDVNKWIRTMLQPGQHAIMVGCAGGDELISMAAMVGDRGCVTGFEPDVEAYHALPPMPPQVSVWCAAVGRQSGMRPFWQHGRVSSLYEANADGGTATETPTVTLDSVADADLIVTDAQGAEVEILDGAPRQLARCPQWIVEVWPKGLRHAGSSAQDVFHRLRKAGLTVRWTEGDDVSEDTITAWEATSAVYVNWRATR